MFVKNSLKRGLYNFIGDYFSEKKLREITRNRDKKREILLEERRKTESIMYKPLNKSYK